MSDLKITGQIIIEGEVREYGENKFKVREFVIETNDQYPQQIPFRLSGKSLEFHNAKIEKGATVEIEFNVRGREWKGKYFINLEVWKVNVLSGAETQEPVEDDGLPF